MKRFDKGYIYSSLLTDFFYSAFLVLVFLKDLFVNDESKPENAEAIPVLVIGYTVVSLLTEFCITEPPDMS